VAGNTTEAADPAGGVVFSGITFRQRTPIPGLAFLGFTSTSGAVAGVETALAAANPSASLGAGSPTFTGKRAASLNAGGYPTHPACTQPSMPSP
jgi:hypothetical protein